MPSVSLRDEITTDGFGMAVIEMLVCAGILQIENRKENEIEWSLGNKWDDKVLRLCLDGLSLDRHRSFQKRLLQLPISFKKAYNQGLAFRKALTRVVEMPGPLH